MKSRNRSREPRSISPEEFYTEDLHDLLGNGGKTGSRKGSRKDRQLCHQVAEALDLVLSGDSRDERLQSLQVLSVVPAPNSLRLLVIVSSDLPVELFDGQAMVELLTRQTPRLRGEVAASINRKRVPLLAFQVLHAATLRP